MGNTLATYNSDTDFIQQHMNTKIALQPDGTYSLKFSWNDNHPPLPSNYACLCSMYQSHGLPTGQDTKPPEDVQCYY